MTAENKQTKQEFVELWANWWTFNKEKKELTGAFERQLDELIKSEVQKALKDTADTINLFLKEYYKKIYSS